MSPEGRVEVTEETFAGKGDADPPKRARLILHFVDDVNNRRDAIEACAFQSGVVSNRGMRQMNLSLWVLLLTVSVWAQPSSANKTEKVAIQRAKSLIVSSFDRSLPNVSLEFFLKYEGEGAPIKWQVSDCGDQTGSSALDQERGPPMCVEADFEFKGQTAVTVLVSVGTFKRRPSGVPALVGMTITESGISRPLRHLSDLPLELHRPAPRFPRDLPFGGEGK
jgi:hypothetical protein